MWAIFCITFSIYHENVAFIRTWTFKTNPINHPSKLIVRLNRFWGKDSDSCYQWLDNTLFRRICAIILLFQVIQTNTVILGILFVSKNKILEDATISLAITIEVFFLLRQMHVHRDHLMIQLIQKRVEDKTMKVIIMSTLKPVEISLKFCCMTGSIIILYCTFLTVIFKKKYFLWGLQITFSSFKATILGGSFYWKIALLLVCICL